MTKLRDVFKMVAPTEVNHGQQMEYFAVLISRKLVLKTKAVVDKVNVQTGIFILYIINSKKDARACFLLRYIISSEGKLLRKKTSK